MNFLFARRIALLAFVLWTPAALFANAEFTWTPNIPAPGDTVQFTDRSTVSVRAWNWTFGDGGTSAVQNPTHVYSSLGTYTVTLGITSTTGGMASLSQSILVTRGFVSSIAPGVISNSRDGDWLPFKIGMSGLKFSQGMTISITGVTIGSVNVIDDGHAEITITDVDPNTPQGLRDINGSGAKGAFEPGKNLLYISNIGVNVEIQQGVIMKCTATRPCLADHYTVLRAKLSCNGSACETGRESATGRLWIFRNSALLGAPMLSVTPTMTIRSTTSPPSVVQRAQGLDGLNFRLNDTLGEGEYEFAFEMDHRNPAVMPSSTGGPDHNRFLVRRATKQPFKASNPSQRVNIAFFVDTGTVADVATALAAMDFIRATYPLSRGSFGARYVPSTLGYKPGLCFTEQCTMEEFGRTLRRLNSNALPPYTNIILFTRNSGFTDRGVSFCTEADGGAKPLRCPANVGIINLNLADSVVGVPAHEVGHTLGFGDSYNADGVGGASRSPLNPFTSDCQALDNGCRVEEGTMDTLNLTVSAIDSARPNFVARLKRDFMGSAARDQRWVNTTLWNVLYNRYNTASASLVDAELAAPAAVDALGVVDTLGVSGVLSKNDKVISFAAERMTTEAGTAEVTPGAYTVEIQSAGGQILASKTLDISFRGAHGAALSEAAFAVNFAFPAGARRVVLKKGTTELASRSISTNAPVVSFISPSGGAVSGTFTVRWSGSDADGDALTYTLLYSPDNTNWSPITKGLTATSYDWDTSIYPGSSTGRLMIVVSDGTNEASATSAPFSLAPKPLVVSITSPSGGAALPGGQPILITGVAYDPQTGELPASALSFSSNISGALGSGRSVMANLPVGRHTITLTATPASGASVSSSIVVTVYQPSQRHRAVGH